MTRIETKTVTFIASDEPPLKAGEYSVQAVQTVNQSGQNSFSASARFAVAGERFTIDPTEIASVFPPNLANGEYEGSLPHVALVRRTLPWERSAGSGSDGAPWLAVLTFDPGNVPVTTKATAKDLVPNGTSITVQGSTVTGTGTLAANYLSYPGLNTLEYGESPDDDCVVIDLPVALFNQIAPAAVDLPFLAHIRESDTSSAPDTTAESLQYAIVLGNRLSQINSSAFAHLVSLEGFVDYLPNPDGSQSAKMPAGVEYVRLLTYQNWRYFANSGGETLIELLEQLNKTPDGRQELTTVQLPLNGPEPTLAEYQQAMQDQEAGALTPDDAIVLVRTAYMLGYAPMKHMLREAGQTVSWYRGPLMPLSPVTTPLPIVSPIPASCSDELNRYNPETGMFDVSYSAAWQTGQLMALQNNTFAVTLYEWKKSQINAAASARGGESIRQKLGNKPLFESFMQLRKERLAAADPSTLPEYVAAWLGRLRLLHGVPFQSLVPDEQMLPTESIRFFWLDPTWIEAVIDGAFSIGRSTKADIEQDRAAIEGVLQSSLTASRFLRKNPLPKAAIADPSGDLVSGFLMRSQAVAGWPQLRVEGFGDLAGTEPVKLLRMARLSSTVLLCLFDGNVQMVSLHEPPEQLHSGVEIDAATGECTTTLRAVTGANPGQQFETDPHGGLPIADIPMRADKQVVQAAAAATSILTKLNTDFNQKITLFTSAEFALEMAKGVVKVDFQATNGMRGTV